MAKLELLYRIVVKDKDGKVVYDSGPRGSKSFVIQWLMAINTATQNVTKTMRDITGTDRAARTASTLRMDAAAGDATKGIVVGTGTTAPTNADYRLASIISHGVGAGQLQYGSQGFTDPAVVAGNVDNVLTRAFVNGSGATITVNEIGAYGYDGTYSFCHIRDVLPAGVDVLNGQTLTVQYTLRTTV